MIEDVDAKDGSRRDQALRHFQIVERWRRIPRRVVVTTMIAAAFARIAALKTSRGYVAAVVMWRRRLKASGEAASRSTDAT